MNAQTFRRRPRPAKAVRWLGTNTDEMNDFAGANFELFDEPCDEDPEATASVFDNLHNTWELVLTGDWIVSEPGREFFAVRDAKFRADFEPLAETALAEAGGTDRG